MKTGVIVLAFLSACLGFTFQGRAQTNTNVVVSFSTTNSTPLNVGFAGFTTEILGKGE